MQVMIHISAPTRWRYIVECQDIESGSIYAVIGSADTREECEGGALHEAEHQRDLYRHVVNIEASELCQECDGDGVIVASELRTESIRCGACNGHKGPFRKIKFTSRPLRFDPADMYGT
jgi:DnaJ-class molecular chaperone